MSEKQTTKPKIGSPTQRFLKFDEIRDDMIIMQDGTLRAVVTVSSTNFDLKNQEEQDALIYNYQRFINSLDFSIQILMQSRKMDIGEYLEKLKQIMDRQTNELLRMQTAEYMEFVGRLVESANIMNKNFYVIVPYNESINPSTGGGVIGKIFGNNKVKAVAGREESLRKYRKTLDERVSTVVNNLSSVGLRTVRLSTEQLIELLYNSYNFSAGPSIDASQLEQINLVDKGGN